MDPLVTQVTCLRIALAQVVLGGSKGLIDVFARLAVRTYCRFYRGCGKPYALWKIESRRVPLWTLQNLFVSLGFAIPPALARLALWGLPKSGFVATVGVFFEGER